MSRAHTGFLRLLAAGLALYGMAGCGGSSTPATVATPPVTPAASGATSVYVLEQPKSGNGTILEFSATATGSVAPISTITPGTPAMQVATDATGNIYLFNGNIVEYAAGATGTAKAIRQIDMGGASRICCVDGMAVGPAGNVVLGQDNGELDEWSATANGSVAPDRYILGLSEIGGGNSPVEVANQVAVDSMDNIYVAPQGIGGVAEVVLFPGTAAGNIAPSEQFGPQGIVNGVTVDSSLNIYTSGGTCSFVSMVQVCQGAITIYPASGLLNPLPSITITGSNTKLGTLWGIQVDSAGNIYVISTDGLGANPTVLKFSKSASGNVAPLSSFTSTSWTTPGFNPSLGLH